MKIPVFLILFGLWLLPVQAQVPRVIDSKKSVTEKLSGRTPKMNRREVWHKLNLSRVQQRQLKQMRTENKARRETIENDPGLDGEQKKLQLAGLKQEQVKKLQEILTPGQFAELKRLMAESRSKEGN
ncbi:MAG TPA: hypothetical protein PLZ45_04365 [Ferruginibacter sp.]|nr:hypothetical protein [Chitinophagaceae bacterium]HRI23881.1 hypothetical protein [Ferruginibacter sp.]